MLHMTGIIQAATCDFFFALQYSCLIAIVYHFDAFVYCYLLLFIFKLIFFLDCYFVTCFNGLLKSYSNVVALYDIRENVP